MRHPLWSPEHPEYGALPWALRTCDAPPSTVVDANGDDVITIGDIEHRSEELECIVMNAPKMKAERDELLAALKYILKFNAGSIERGSEWEALIARIEGGK